ncbi:MAG: hypothetical protein DRO90_02375 [Candidatus Altiarchaeales archaeon]|nr:MAG: hypothetical protein DRO90_02375 [Candidatus Altiarchaeales archaeon]
MAIEDIEKAIKEDTRKKIDEINREMNETIKIIHEEIENEIKKNVEKIKRDGEREAELTYKRIVADANIKSREMIEKEKNELVEKVFEEARNRILNASDREKTRILKILIEKGKEAIEDPVILVDKKYSSLVKGCKKVNINDFGVILKSRDGFVTVDNTLNSIIERSKIKLKYKVASILFK